jgi:uncharacterized linocin/CFP29 family protein
MNHLLRSLAPISDAGWELLDREARECLAPALAARKLVDFSGPLGRPTDTTWLREAGEEGRAAEHAAMTGTDRATYPASSPA